MTEESYTETYLFRLVDRSSGNQSLLTPLDHLLIVQMETIPYRQGEGGRGRRGCEAREVERGRQGRWGGRGGGEGYCAI